MKGHLPQDKSVCLIIISKYFSDSEYDRYVSPRQSRNSSATGKLSDNVCSSPFLLPGLYYLSPSIMFASIKTIPFNKSCLLKPDQRNPPLGEIVQWRWGKEKREWSIFYLSPETFHKTSILAEMFIKKYC